MDDSAKGGLNPFWELFIVISCTPKDFKQHWYLKGGTKEETLLQKQNCVQEAKNIFGKFQKHLFCSQDADFV